MRMDEKRIEQSCQIRLPNSEGQIVTEEGYDVKKGGIMCSCQESENVFFLLANTKDKSCRLRRNNNCCIPNGHNSFFYPPTFHAQYNKNGMECQLI